MLYICFALTLIGTLVPWFFLGSFLQGNYWNFAALLPAIMANDASVSFSADLVISSVAFWLLLWQQKESRWLYLVALNLGLGLSCALPAWMCLRELRKIRMSEQAG